MLENGQLTIPAFQRACALTDRLIAHHSKTFYFATQLLSRQKRLAIRALYAICRLTDDLVDEEHASAERMEEWREQVRRPAEQQERPELAIWAHVRERYSIDPRYQDELIDGVKMDIEFRLYDTWEDLQVYCYRVASTVGLLSIPVVGLAKDYTFEEAAPYAIKLGMALQLTNILRDVGEDARRGRVYLPVADLRAFDLTVDDIHHRVLDGRFIALMRFEIERARRLYLEALPGIAMLQTMGRPAVGAAALLYGAILDEIELMQYQVHQMRAHLSGWRKLRMLPGILQAVQRVQPPRPHTSWSSQGQSG